jgi:hypothetical protein
VSAHIDAQTVVTDSYRKTSIIRTLRERWNLGPPLTQRDATAPDIAPVLTRTTDRKRTARRRAPAGASTDLAEVSTPSRTPG